MTQETDLLENMNTAEICAVLRSLFPDGLRLTSTTLLFNQRSIAERCNYSRRIAWNRHKKPHESSLRVAGVALTNVYGSGYALLDFGNGSSRIINAVDDCNVHQDDMGQPYCDYFVNLSIMGYGNATISRA